MKYLALLALVVFLPACALNSVIVPLGSKENQAKVYPPAAPATVGVFRSTIPFPNYDEIALITLRSDHLGFSLLYDKLRKDGAAYGADAVVHFKYARKTVTVPIVNTVCDANGVCVQETKWEDETHYFASGTLIRKK